MYRRVVSLLLLPFVLTSQSVTVGHCHGGSSPAGHDPRPHVHLNSKSASPSRGDRPCACGRQHHHEHEADAQEAREQPASTPDSPPCDDSVAIFFGSADDAVVERTNPEVEGGSSTWWCAAEATQLAPFGDHAPVVPSAFTRPPPASPPPCPIYVLHLALLI